MDWTAFMQFPRVTWQLRALDSWEFLGFAEKSLTEYLRLPIEGMGRSMQRAGVVGSLRGILETRLPRLEMTLENRLGRRFLSSM
jgi:hypothetical protein